MSCSGSSSASATHTRRRHCARTVTYYDARTSYGSTLSYLVYAGVLRGRSTLAASWQRYMVALESDVGDVQGGTTAEGIHMGVMSGTLDLVQRSYLGEVIRDGRPSPSSPRPWTSCAISPFPCASEGCRLRSPSRAIVCGSAPRSTSLNLKPIGNSVCRRPDTGDQVR